MLCFGFCSCCFRCWFLVCFVLCDCMSTSLCFSRTPHLGLNYEECLVIGGGRDGGGGILDLGWWGGQEFEGWFD